MTLMLAGSGLMTFVLIAVGFLLLTTLMQRPLKKQQAQQAQMRDQIAAGTRVMLSSGLFGSVTHVGNEQLIVELAPGVEVTCLKQAVAKVVTAADEEFEFADEDAAETRHEEARDIVTAPAVAPATGIGSGAGNGSSAAPRPEDVTTTTTRTVPGAGRRVEGAGDEVPVDQETGDAAAMDDAAPGTQEGLGFPGAPGRAN